MKKCTVCGKEKPLSDFYKRKAKGKDYIVAKCKKCFYETTDKKLSKDSQKNYRDRMREKYGTIPYVHKSMRNRCENPNAKDYKNYGAKGISVCDEWKKVIPFCEWALDNGYEKGLQIDRIDPDKGYCPENCRFITRIENLRRRKFVKLTMRKAEAMRVLSKNGFSNSEIAGIFDIRQGHAHKVLKNLTWRK